MNLENLKKQLIIDEGRRLEVYLDSKGLPTVGIGHLITKDDPEYFAWKNLPEGGKLRISEERLEQLFKKDMENVCDDCRFFFSDFYSFAEEIQEIIANMMFNLGRNRFAGFKKLITCLKSRDYKGAAREMKDSKWFSDVKDRAERLVKRMENFKA